MIIRRERISRRNERRRREGTEEGDRRDVERMWKKKNEKGIDNEGRKRSTGKKKENRGRGEERKEREGEKRKEGEDREGICKKGKEKYIETEGRKRRRE